MSKTSFVHKRSLWQYQTLYFINTLLDNEKSFALFFRWPTLHLFALLKSSFKKSNVAIPDEFTFFDLHSDTMLNCL